MNDAPHQPFIGQIDELAVYGRTLTEQEIFSIYLRELRWYQDSAISFITGRFRRTNH